MPNQVKPQDSVHSQNGSEIGTLTGSTHRCRMEGCTGRRVTVRWPDGKFTHPCTKGLTTRPDGSYQIGG